MTLSQISHRGWRGPRTQLPTPVVWDGPQAPQGLDCTAKVSEVPVGAATAWETKLQTGSHVGTSGSEQQQTRG